MTTTATGLTPAERREGFLLGAEIGAMLAAQTSGTRDVDALRQLTRGGVAPEAPPEGMAYPPVALADALLAELVTGGVDLRRLARRWVDARATMAGPSPSLDDALAHLEQFDAPRTTAAEPCIDAVTAALPAALTASNPQAMIAGTFHVARLLDPSPVTGLVAVALVVAASRLLAGHRDVIPDVTAVLRVNEAPPRLIEAVQRVPRDPRAAPEMPVGSAPDQAAVLSWVLWQVEHRRNGIAVLEAMVMSGGFSPAVGSLLGALVGARDGITGWPARWLAPPVLDARRALSRRLSS